MRRERYIFQSFLLAMGLLILVPILIAFSAIDRIQGYGKVINYTGVVRGGAQRLVKSELAGIPRDDIAEMLDEVLQELVVGGGMRGIKPLREAANYQAYIAQAAEQWAMLKVEIAARRAGEDSEDLFRISEVLFILCDKAAFEAERYSNEQIGRLKREMAFVLVVLTAACGGLVFEYRRSAKLLERSNTEREAEEQTRLCNEERYRIIMERTQEILFEWDMKKRCAYSSPYFKEKFGYSLPKGCFFTHPSSMRICEEDIDAFKCMLGCLASGREEYTEVECRVLDSQKNEIWCSIKATVIKDRNGEPERLIGILSDIDAQKRSLLELEEKASCDLPTGVFNKYTLEKRVEEFLCGEGRDGAHVLYIIDLDHFKSINDGYGHVYGDYALCETAKRIKALFRETDIVGRIGGDEFVVLLKNVASAEAICKRAELVLGKIREPMQGIEDVGTLSFSASVGVALYPMDGSTFRQLYQNADRALYVSKEKGRNAFNVYDSTWMRQGTHNLSQRERIEEESKSDRM